MLNCMKKKLEGQLKNWGEEEAKLKESKGGV